MRLLVLLSLMLASCSKPERQITQFYVGVRNYYGSTGDSYYYAFTRDSLKVYYNCEEENCSEKIIYKQLNNKRDILNFEDFLDKFDIDSLNALYEDKDVMDGLYQTIFIQKNANKMKAVQLKNFEHATIDTLISKLEPIVRDPRLLPLRR